VSNDYESIQNSGNGQSSYATTLHMTPVESVDISRTPPESRGSLFLGEGKLAVSDPDESQLQPSSPDPQVNRPVEDAAGAPVKSTPFRQEPFTDLPLGRKDMHALITDQTDGKTVARSYTGSKNGTALAVIAHEEQIKLTHQVFLTGMGQPQIVVFCGVESGNGCSRVCTESAIELAEQTSERVCLIDANLRSPFLHDVFGLTNGKGFAEALRNQGHIREYSTLVDNLWIMTSGDHTSDATSLLTRDNLTPYMQELRETFDFVLLDAPPLNRFADAASLARLADGVVLVLEANSTRRDAARKATDDLRSANAKILAAVLNKRKFPIPETIYRRI